MDYVHLRLKGGGDGEQGGSFKSAMLTPKLASHYSGLVDGILKDTSDERAIAEDGVRKLDIHIPGWDAVTVQVAAELWRLLASGLEPQDALESMMPQPSDLFGGVARSVLKAIDAMAMDEVCGVMEKALVRGLVSGCGSHVAGSTEAALVALGDHPIAIRAMHKALDRLTACVDGCQNPRFSHADLIKAVHEHGAVLVVHKESPLDMRCKHVFLLATPSVYRESRTRQPGKSYKTCDDDDCAMVFQEPKDSAIADDTLVLSTFEACTLCNHGGIELENFAHIESMPASNIAVMKEPKALRWAKSMLPSAFDKNTEPARIAVLVFKENDNDNDNNNDNDYFKVLYHARMSLKELEGPFTI